MHVRLSQDNYVQEKRQTLLTATLRSQSTLRPQSSQQGNADWILPPPDRGKAQNGLSGHPHNWNSVKNDSRTSPNVNAWDCLGAPKTQAGLVSFSSTFFSQQLALLQPAFLGAHPLKPPRQLQQLRRLR